MNGLNGTRIVLDAVSAEVASARRFVRRALAGEVDPTVVGDLQLITSELFTNAIEHGLHHQVELSVDCHDGTAEVTVRSHGPADVGPATDWEVAHADSITGRGLGIVRHLADELIVERTSDSFVVTARRHAHQPSGA
jgi:anti-sigma regulatory factor (Ser/Thr protein kinase)